MKIETFEHPCFAGGPDQPGPTTCGFVVSVDGRRHIMRRIRVILPNGRRVFNTVDDAEAWANSTGVTLDPAEVAECRRLTS
jgi:hypothetical protein